MGLLGPSCSDGKLAEAIFQATKLQTATPPGNETSEGSASACTMAPAANAGASAEALTVAFWRCLHAGDEAAARFCFDVVRCCSGAGSGDETGNNGHQARHRLLMNMSYKLMPSAHAMTVAISLLVTFRV